MAAVQQNVTYKRELLAGDIVEVRSRLLEIRDKSVRFLHEMRNAETGEIDCRNLRIRRRPHGPAGPQVHAVSRCDHKDGREIDRLSRGGRSVGFALRAPRKRLVRYIDKRAPGSPDAGGFRVDRQ